MKFTCSTSIKKKNCTCCRLLILIIIILLPTLRQRVSTGLNKVADGTNGRTWARKGKSCRWNQQEKIRAHSARSQRSAARMIGVRETSQCEPATGSPDAMQWLRQRQRQVEPQLQLQFQTRPQQKPRQQVLAVASRPWMRERTNNPRTGTMRLAAVASSVFYGT